MPDEKKRCATCGTELAEGPCLRCADKAVSKIVRLDALRLVLLSAIAILCFLGTRALARLDQSNDQKQAQVYYQRGTEALAEGQQKIAIQDLRDATIHDRNQPRYALALAQALFGAGQDDEALQLLLRIREDDPEEPQINLQLARLEARRGDTANAELYYHHALYGIWKGEAADEQRRNIRLELIKFLAGDHQRDAAMSELLALQAEAPKDRDIQIEMGNSALQLDDANRAKTIFEQVLREDKSNESALTGLAKAQLRLGEFSSALRAVHEVASRTGNLSPDLSRLQTSLQWIDQNTPVKRGLKRPERFARLNLMLDLALQRVKTCSLSKIDAALKSSLQQLDGQITAMQSQLTPESDTSIEDLLQDSFSLIRRAEDTADKACDSPSPIDDALYALSQSHAAGER